MVHRGVLGGLSIVVYSVFEGLPIGVFGYLSGLSMKFFCLHSVLFIRSYGLLGGFTEFFGRLRESCVKPLVGEVSNQDNWVIGWDSSNLRPNEVLPDFSGTLIYLFFI